MGLEEISVAGRAEGLGVFQTLRDVAEVSLVLQDAHEVVAVGDQLLHVDVSRGIDHFLEKSLPHRIGFYGSLGFQTLFFKK